MTHIELLNDRDNEKVLADLQCRRDPCHPELGGGGFTLGPPEAEEGDDAEVFGPIQPCVWP
jgi:hypothetical protein